jgi:hypothetical protein
MGAATVLARGLPAGAKAQPNLHARPLDRGQAGGSALAARVGERDRF